MKSILLISIFVLSIIIITLRASNKWNIMGDERSQIIVSLSTSPQRILKIKPMIDSIINQNLVPDKIILNLPYVFKRNNSKFDQIPSFLTKNKLVFINWCEDIGPLTKILPSIQLAKSPNDIVICVDDDILYPKYLIKKMVAKATLLPNCVVTGMGYFKYDDDNYRLAQGFTGILFRKRFLSDFPIEDISKYPISCYLGDDVILSNFLAKKNIKIKSLDLTMWQNEKRVLPYGEEPDAIHLSHKNSNFYGHDYRSCINYLKENNDYHMDDFEKALQ